MHSEKILAVDYTSRGVGMTDAQIKPFVDALVLRVNKEAGDTRIVIGCETILSCIRAAVASGKMPGVAVDVYEEGVYSARIDDDGRFVGTVVPRESIIDEFGEILFTIAMDKIDTSEFRA